MKRLVYWICQISLYPSETSEPFRIQLPLLHVTPTSLSDVELKAGHAVTMRAGLLVQRRPELHLQSVSGVL